MSLHSLPLFMRLNGRAVIVVGDGEQAEPKRRLLERSGAVVVGEDAPSSLAIVAIEDDVEAEAAVARLKARGVLVNAVDRPDLCDFTLPAIIDRDPVLIAIGTGGASAGLAAALRHRLEAMLPAGLGTLVTALQAARGAMRARFPDGGDRRRALGVALAPGGPLDPLAPAADDAVTAWLAAAAVPAGRLEQIALTSPDPDDLTLRQARWLALADRVYHAAGTPPAILNRARADAERLCAPVSLPLPPGLSIALVMP